MFHDGCGFLVGGCVCDVSSRREQHFRVRGSHQRTSHARRNKSVREKKREQGVTVVSQQPAGRDRKEERTGGIPRSSSPSHRGHTRGAEGDGVLKRTVSRRRRRSNKSQGGSSVHRRGWYTVHCGRRDVPRRLWFFWWGVCLRCFKPSRAALPCPWVSSANLTRAKKQVRS